MLEYKITQSTKFILGGAQLGLKYGVMKKINTSKKVSSILNLALKNKIHTIDTARIYGDSEKNIGEYLRYNRNRKIRIITKLKPYNYRYSNENLKNEIEKNIIITLKNLRLKKIDTILLHKASNLEKNDKLIWKYLIYLKQKKIVKNIGISIQNVKELRKALSLKDVSVIQLPFNILDNRWDKLIPKIIKEKKKRGLEIHARSIFLQGLLLNRERKYWKKTKATNLKEIDNWLCIKSEQFKRKSIIDLCITYVKSQNWIDGIVVGIDNIKQLRDNIALFNNKNLTLDNINEIDLSRPKVNNVLLNPNKWRK